MTKQEMHMITAAAGDYLRTAAAARRRADDAGWSVAADEGLWAAVDRTYEAFATVAANLGLSAEAMESALDDAAAL